jgi:hypothetical protein
MKSAMIVASATLSAILAGPLQAASVIEGVTATASSWWSMPNEETPYQAPVNLVNNLGMANPYDITATHAADGDASGQWHAKSWADDPNPVLTFDLGGAFDLEGIHIWNGNQGRFGEDNTGRGVNEFVLSVSTDGVNYTTVGTYNLTRSPFVDNNVGPINAQSFDLAGHNGITHARILVNSIHDPANPYANLSEVMFTANIVPAVFSLSRFEVAEDSVTLAFPSEPGQVFDIYRSADLNNGFDTPLVANLPAAEAVVPVEGVIDIFDGGVELVDSEVNFGQFLNETESYLFVPTNGANEGREIAVVDWSGNIITLAEDLASDLTWSGPYEIKTPVPTETEWIDNARLQGKAFYKIGRR